MYEILREGRPVGRATISKEGLFYRINCCCSLPEDSIFRVSVTDGSNICDLGICVPDGNQYSCVARVPCKRFQGKFFSFMVTDKEERLSVLIETNKPFAYLDKLSAARLRFVNGQQEIVIDLNQDRRDNDRNQILRHK